MIAFQGGREEDLSPYTIKAKEVVYTHVHACVRVCICMCVTQMGMRGGVGPERPGSFTRLNFRENNGNFIAERYASRLPIKRHRSSNQRPRISPNLYCQTLACSPSL